MCSVSLSNGAWVPLTTLKATPTDPTAGWYVDASPQQNQISTPYTWRGIAVSSGQVRAQVDYFGRTKTAVAALSVVSRAWNTPTLTSPVVLTSVGQSSQTNMYPYPHTRRFGLFGIYLDYSPVVTQVLGGPNDAVWYLQSQPALVDTIWIHPALSSSTATGQALQWYNDQNGVGSGGCGTSAVATLRSEVMTHEGVNLSSNSHWGHWSASLPGSSFSAILEQVVSAQQVLMTPKITQAIAPWANAQNQSELTWDGSEAVRIANLVGCSFDYRLVGDGG
jgi:hypothetical protein